MATSLVRSCGRPAINGYRYCYLCKSAVENEMREETT